MDLHLSAAPPLSYQARYNALPEVGEADERLSALGRERTLDGLIDVILRHGVEEQAGIRLLHQHSLIEGGEIMLEEEEDDGPGARALTTRPVQRSPGGAVAPNSWSWTGRDWAPVEFSDDAIVVAHAGTLARRPAFLAEFGEALDRLDAAGTLGLCVADRTFFAQAPGGDGSILVETTHAGRRANVLRFDALANYDPDKLYQTVWVAAASGMNTSCLPLCTYKCAIKFTCDDSGSSHKKKVGHDHSHPKEH